MEEKLKCPTCQQEVGINWNFCPNCGKSLREIPPSASFFRQILIYLVSFFLPPFGLGYAFKYLRQKDSTSRIIGVIAIILTLVSLIMVIAVTKGFMDYYRKILNDLSTGHYP